MTEAHDLISPVVNPVSNELHYGLTKREFFAAMALQGLCHEGAFSKAIQSQAERIGSTSSVAIATYAVDLADELINELNRGK